MLLKEQGTLQTPVSVFSAQHEHATVAPAQAQFYKQLIPLSKPGTGEQYAFKVDLDRCTGCKGCVAACHSLNGLDDDETWRDVGTIHGGLEGASYTQTVTTACHHCADPACLNGCPVLAYEKDPETGIVRHLDDQCIGCQYCVLKCPYDVPKYSKSLGIVRKCDMCHDRLAEGEAPACVQACPTEAISITIVNTQSVTDAAHSGATFLPAAPSAEYTVPTTQYVTNREIPANVEASDHYALRPEHAHLPLVVMLVLTQLSAGLYAFSLIPSDGAVANTARLIAFVAMGIGLAASTSHLGRPLGAWRAFLGLRRSWLSREIVIFGGFSGVAAAYTASGFFEQIPASVVLLLGLATVGTGLLGVFCSVMIYHDTQRPFWNFPVSYGKFFGTTFGLSLAAYLSVHSVVSTEHTPSVGLVAVIGLFLIKMSLEATQLRAANQSEMAPAKKSALLMLKPLKAITLARYSFGVAGLLCFAGVLVGVAPSSLLSVSGFVLLLVGELLERVLFFQAVAAPKMPGAFTS
jgi:Fe-S-cluster-containing dehydrogenase component/DMSO reductase anchor subunit